MGKAEPWSALLFCTPESFALEACQAVSRACACRGAVGRIQASQGKRAGRAEIAYAMLMVDGERFQRFASGSPGAEWDVQQLAPACRCVVVPAGAPRGTRERTERIDSNRGRLRLLQRIGSSPSCARTPRQRDPPIRRADTRDRAPAPRARPAPSRDHRCRSCSRRAVRPASDSRSSRLCSNTAPSGRASPFRRN